MITDTNTNRHKEARWTRLFRWCNARFEGSDDGVTGDNSEVRSPRSIDLLPMRVLALVQWSVAVPVGDGSCGKFRQCCVLPDHLSLFFDDCSC